MLREPLTKHNLTSPNIHQKIQLLIQNLTNLSDPTGQYLQHLPDGRTIDTKSWHDWEWTHGIGLYGIWQYYTLTNSPEYLAIIEEWFAEQLPIGTTKNINTMAVFLTLACVYEHTRNQYYLPYLEAWAEWALHDLPRTKFGGMAHCTYERANAQQLWDDTLMMTVLSLAKIGKVLGRKDYVDEAVRQVLLHVKFLYDVKTGLWFHGWTFDDGGHHFAGALWARGNSWVTMFIPEFLELLDLENDDPVRRHLIDTLQAQIEALAKMQRDSGLWSTLLHEDVVEGNYEEASATAGFAFGILKAVRKRLVGSEYEEIGVQALKGILSHVNELGEFEKVSFGTAMGGDLKHYLRIPLTAMPYGQAMAIMALVEFLRRFM